MSNHEPKLKSSRRWRPRFGLQTLFVLFTAASLCLGFWAHRTREQHDAVQANGGNVSYDYECNGNDRDRNWGIPSDGDHVPPGPAWLRHFIGLDGLASVVSIGIGNSEVSDLAPLRQLPHLRSIELPYESPKIRSLAAIENLKCLRFLYASRSQISDLRPLAHLTELEYLLLEKTPVRNLAPLSGLTNLRYLTLGQTNVVDVAPLAALVDLNYLNLENTQVVDLAPLRKLTNLKDLILWQTRVSDLAYLSRMTNLRSVRLGKTHVCDLAPLSQLTQLESVDLQSTNVVDLTPLAGLTNLRWLNLADTQIDDITPLANTSASNQAKWVSAAKK